MVRYLPQASYAYFVESARRDGLGENPVNSEMPLPEIWHRRDDSCVRKAVLRLGCLVV